MEEEENEYGWKYLPEILLEDIFTLLPVKHRHEASQVCSTWYQTFYAPRVWETFILKGRTLTKRRFNFYKGYQCELCPRKTQTFLARVGHLIKRIIITPMSDFYNLYEFLRVLSFFLGYFDEFPMPLMKSFDFTFACASRGMSGLVIHGTGGKILDVLKELIVKMPTLRKITVNNLLLEEVEVPGFLDSVLQGGSESLRQIELLNCSKAPYPLIEISQFPNLQILKTSPHHVNDEVALLLGGSGLVELHLVQNEYSCDTIAVSDEAWRLIKEMAPYFKVTLELTGITKSSLLLQPHAPVHKIVYDTPYSKVENENAIFIVHYYQRTLEQFIQKRLPRAHGPRSFHERGDASFVMLVRGCPRLRVLIIHERISTATAILLSKENKRLDTFIVRQNALIKRADWPIESGQNKEDYYEFRQNARCFEKMTKQVSKNLAKSWKPLTDKSFKFL